ncbi:hypothetical protein DNTS_000408 [Danionella cerebrum]|uniref:Serpin B6 n=1 Tax=Danionella cerebrum TaxID=2873325 RepID=A0A553MZH3_9TELE|nr:hypothetical protein DNTS_000408 [Danionella translucida]
MKILLVLPVLITAQLVEMESLSSANMRFNLNLFHTMSRGNASSNLFYSPVSISLALTMVSLGAKGNTEAQMYKVLGFNNFTKSANVSLIPEVLPAKTPTTDPHLMAQTEKFDLPELTKSAAELEKKAEKIQCSFKKLMSVLNKAGISYVLRLANRLYGEQSYQFVEKFINDTKEYYNSGLQLIDFKNKPQTARVTINKWVEKKTNGKIKYLIPPRAIDTLTKLVLVNAIYFKGSWEKKFPNEATTDGNFRVNKNQTKPVKMMKQTSQFSLADIPEVNSQLEKALTNQKLMEWTSPNMLQLRPVQVFLPKFRMGHTYDMKSILVSLGMDDVFDGGRVNLSGVSPNNDLVLSKVIHKAFIEVNEEGTKAAAATGAIEEIRSFPQRFIADHPFIFFIRHNPSHTMLFFGRFCTP